MADVDIRAAGVDDLAEVASLRWRWVVDRGDAPTRGFEQFVQDFVAWAQVNAATHQCHVAVVDGAVVGMAWLARVARVPSPSAPRRLSGDLQSVYVVPELRGQGVGRRLVAAVLTAAREQGMERVTVHSSWDAVETYRRSGFLQTPLLLQATVTEG